MPLSDLTDATAVTLALDEFDELGRDAFLSKYGFGPSRSYFVKRDDRLYDSKAIAGAAYGIQFPEQGHLPASGFNGGEIGVQRHLERLGFQMIVKGADEAELGELGDGGPSFGTLFKSFAAELSEARERKFKRTASVWNAKELIEQCIRDFSALQKRPDLEISSSVGYGEWADVPYFLIRNPVVSTGAQEGLYVVILVAKDLDRMYLTLNQGSASLQKEFGSVAAKKRMIDAAEVIRPHISDLESAGFLLDNEIDLGVPHGRPQSYQIATIAHYDIRTDSIPDDDRIETLLEAVLAAYETAVHVQAVPEVEPESFPVTEDANVEDAPMAQPAEPYGMEDALAELFLSRQDLERLLVIWKTKKNMILQGAPGVGKSFVAKRLAYLLLGEKDLSRVETVQFHQSYSYEDFVQGYRPDGEGGFEIRDGVFHRFCEKAKAAPNRDHVFIIDEINRGNLSKILGELMLLIEHDKRGREWATKLTYARPGHPFFIPENVRILGMMNTADRSLSLVDYALRRRFTFAALDPMFDRPGFRDLLVSRGVPEDTVELIRIRMTGLNAEIGDDRANLGPGYRIGHSFFVPAQDLEFDPGWYRRVIETEISPLLEEYWFDDPDKAASWHDRLLAGSP